jgi:shikimate dehydrogenase
MSDNSRHGNRGIDGLAIDAGTALYAVFGDPVAHSLSPAMHNRAFSICGIQAVYLAFRITDIAAAVGAVRTLPVRGVSVTLPHKVAVMGYLDSVDDTAHDIGAVNTLVWRGGALHGTNTDGAGAVGALREAAGLKGRQGAVIGAGGAARAVVHGMAAAGARVTVVNRSEERGKRLAARQQTAYCPLGAFGGLEWDILVNATPVGMHPDVDAIPVPEEEIRPGTVVMDTVYNPMRTRLIHAAAKRGCRVVTGDAMFVHQGAAQFTLWTGRPAPVEAMREAVRTALGATPAEAV